MRTLLATFIILGIVSVCQCSPTLDKYDDGYPPSNRMAASGYPRDKKSQYEPNPHPDNNLDENEITLEELLRAYELIKEGHDLDGIDSVDTKGYGAPDTPPEPATTTDLPERNIDLAAAIADKYMQQLAADTNNANEPEVNAANQALRNFNAPRNRESNTIEETIEESREMAELEALALLTSSDEQFLREIEESELFTRVSTDPNCRQEKDCTDNENLNIKDGVEYRTMDGRCNNINNFEYGMSNVQHVRLLKNKYDDGKWRPRRDGKDKKRLSSPRLISNVVHNSTVDKSDGQTLAIAMFYYMQFIDHDLAKTPEGHVDDDVECCAAKRVRGKKGKFCLRFDLPRRDEDHFEDGFCFESRRSEIVKTCGGDVFLNQVNEITSYMDASMVYGSSDDEMNTLRSKNGKGDELAVSNENFPPISTNEHLPCNRTEGDTCFETGDIRANVHPGLTTYHTMFVREHNRIVKKLAALGTGWDDESLFQEGRKIISAMIQHITYTYMLPKMFDANKLQEYGVSTQYEYDNTVDASMTQAFSIGYRLHHLMPSELHLAHMDGNTVENYATVPQELVYLKPHFLTDNNYEGINNVALGMVRSSCPHVNRQMNNASRNLLFLDKDGNSLDLIALNIMRGREWGMPSYTEYAQLCTGKDINSWEDLTGIMSEDAIAQLKKVYTNVQDIDLWTGLVSETPLEGSILGPTHTCLLAKHFANIKHGDRFWYEAEGQFSLRQLTEIKKTTLARILCSNLDGVSKMRDDVFDMHSEWIFCDKIVGDHDMEFSEWNQA